MQQPLCHLYFHTMMENRGLHNRTLNSLKDLACNIQQAMKAATGGKAILLSVEFQAVLLILLQRLAFYLHRSQNREELAISKINKLVTTSYTSTSGVISTFRFV